VPKKKKSAISVFDCPQPPENTDIDRYTGIAMTDWFSPALLIRTALRQVASTLFATYSDKRTLLAAVNDATPFVTEWSSQDRITVDYVADLGDGWDSTYSVAWGLAQPELTVDDGMTPLARGEILVMGGDQVYPYASSDEYKNRLARPYQAALPCSDESTAPTVFAIPGNHDWYDGLSSFMRYFGQQRWFAGWRTRQTRSYWAVQLPHRWWLWGIDSQLDAYIDHAQIRYFRETAETHMQPGDRVILCVAEPSWIFANNGDATLHRNLSFVENEIINKHGGHLALTVSGDLHHYAHYTERAPDAGKARHKVTCGGGGAFSHGTHHLPDELDLGDDEEIYDSTGEYLPSASDSRAMLWRNLLMPLRHPLFAAVIGGFYLVYAWVLNRTLLLPELSAIPFAIENVEKIPSLFIKSTFTSLLAVAFLLLLVMSGAMFAQPDWKSCPGRKPIRKWLGGIVHSVLHLVVLLGSLWYIATESWITIPPDPPEWGSAVYFSLAIGLSGALIGGVVFGLYLILSNLLFGFHRTEAFSAVADKDHKSFLRIQIGADGATVYAIGMNRSGSKWQWSSDKANGASWISPRDGELHFRLIEKWRIG